MNKTYEVRLIANPFIKAKFSGKLHKISAVHIQEWAIASLVTNAICTTAGKRFFTKLFTMMGFAGDCRHLAQHALDTCEKIANAVPED